MIFPPPIYSIFTNLSQYLAKMDQNVQKNMENARFSLFTMSEGKHDIAFNIALKGIRRCWQATKYTGPPSY